MLRLRARFPRVLSWVRASTLTPSTSRGTEAATVVATGGSTTVAIRSCSNFFTSGDWNCPSCNYVNFSKRDTCQHCGVAQSGPDRRGAVSVFGGTAKPGDWFCSGCNFHNFANRVSCFKCGGSKEECALDDPANRPGWKSGDWLCSRPGCNEHNFSSRTVCYKCSSPKKEGYTE